MNASAISSHRGLHEYEIADFVRLQQSHPGLHTKILRNIGVALATKLRKVNQDVSILSADRG